MSPSTAVHTCERASCRNPHKGKIFQYFAYLRPRTNGVCEHYHNLKKDARRLFRKKNTETEGVSLKSKRYKPARTMPENSIKKSRE